MSLIDKVEDIPDGTEITLIIEEQTTITPEEHLARLQAFFAQPSQVSEDFLEAMDVVEHERQLSRELARLNLQLQTSADDTPLTSLIGTAPGSFATPEEADQFIRQERDEWDS